MFLNRSCTKRPRVAHMFNHAWWRLAVGGWWRLAVGSWQLAVGGGWWLVIGGWWRSAAVGGWWLVVGGGWWLAVGGPLGRSLRAVLNKKKSSSLRTPLPTVVRTLHSSKDDHKANVSVWARALLASGLGGPTEKGHPLTRHLSPRSSADVRTRPRHRVHTFAEQHTPPRDPSTPPFRGAPALWMSRDSLGHRHSLCEGSGKRRHEAAFRRSYFAHPLSLRRFRNPVGLPGVPGLWVPVISHTLFLTHLCAELYLPPNTPILKVILVSLFFVQTKVSWRTLFITWYLRQPL